jgi:2-C-methyl-D-erythritol 2,4-cyclodiphosphate synthase
MYRVGLGQDSHKLQGAGGRVIGKKLILGGVEVSEKYYLEADSDGDVIIHSLCNALSTAIGGGSLDTWAGKMNKAGILDSREYLRKILEKVRKEKYKINNVSVMVEAGKPTLEEWREKMQISLAKIMKIKPRQIGIAFTSGEGLTSFGKGEGIQAICTVLIEK